MINGLYRLQITLFFALNRQRDPHVFREGFVDRFDPRVPAHRLRRPGDVPARLRGPAERVHGVEGGGAVRVHPRLQGAEQDGHRHQRKSQTGRSSWYVNTELFHSERLTSFLRILQTTDRETHSVTDFFPMQYMYSSTVLSPFLCSGSIFL